MATPVDKLAANPPKYRGGATDINDPHPMATRSGEGSQGSTKLVGRETEPGRHDYPCPPPVLGFPVTGDLGYLGHFKSQDVLEKGHNVGLSRKLVGRVARSGVEVNAVANPVLAAKVARRQAVSSARQTGDQAAVKAARQMGTTAVKSARTERAAFDAKSSRGSRSALKSTLLGTRNVLKARRSGY